MGIGRALTNLIGNCTATVAIARWENDIDLTRAQAALDGNAKHLADDTQPLAKTMPAPQKGELRG
ncbi:C4-dicarboxylate transport protein [compost metagenome]